MSNRSMEYATNSSRSLCRISGPLTTLVLHRMTGIFLLLFMLTAMLGLVAILATVQRARRLHRPLFLLLVAFCISDIPFVMVVFPLQASIFLTDGETAGKAVCDLIAYVTTLTNSTACCIIGLMALYRDFQVCHAHLYRVLKKPRWIVVVVGLAWILPLIISVPLGGPIVFRTHRLTCHFSGPYLYFILAGVLYIPVTLAVVISYLHIYWHVKRSRRRVHHALFSIQTPEQAAADEAGNIHNSADQVVFRLSMIIFAEFFLFFVSPGVLHTVYIYVDADAQCIIGLFAQILSRGRPLVNVVTCFATNKELRSECKALLASGFGYSGG